MEGPVLYPFGAAPGMVTVSSRKIEIRVSPIERNEDLSLALKYFGDQHAMKRTMDADLFTPGPIGARQR
jgi:hypothetical protein